MPQEILRIGGVEIEPGDRKSINLPVARLYTHTEMTVPVQVIRGKKPGKRLFLSAAVHGDEILGVEIIRRVLAMESLKRLKGTLIAVPVVNVFGFLNNSRYLPDRRDLNRFFPGQGEGSLTSRLARLFMEEIVAHSTHGIDLHTGSNHRANLPQIRANLDDAETERLARAFGAPILIDSGLRDGSLRQAVEKKGVPILLYEGGEALRFNETAIRVGVRGVTAVMRELGMLPQTRASHARPEPVVARNTTWVRAPMSGIFHNRVALGDVVEKDQNIGQVADPFGEDAKEVKSPLRGVVIGCLKLPLVHRGDALFHLADISGRKDPEAADISLSISELLPMAERGENLDL